MGHQRGTLSTGPASVCSNPTFLLSKRCPSSVLKCPEHQPFLFFRGHPPSLSPSSLLNLYHFSLYCPFPSAYVWSPPLFYNPIFSLPPPSLAFLLQLNFFAFHLLGNPMQPTFYPQYSVKVTTLPDCKIQWTLSIHYLNVPFYCIPHSGSPKTLSHQFPGYRFLHFLPLPLNCFLLVSFADSLSSILSYSYHSLLSPSHHKI